MTQADNSFNKNLQFEQQESGEIHLQEFLCLIIVDELSGEVVSWSDNIETLGFKLPKGEVFFKSLFPHADDINKYKPKGKFKILEIAVSTEFRKKSLVTQFGNFLYFHFENDSYTFAGIFSL